MSVYDYIEIDDNAEKLKYTVIQSVSYHSKRYNKDIIADVGFKSDGATGALDIDSLGWLFHDICCATGEFSDGTKCNNWQASMVLSDILAEEGRWFRSKSWFVATWLFGGGEARKNGMW